MASTASSKSFTHLAADMADISEKSSAFVHLSGPEISEKCLTGQPLVPSQTWEKAHPGSGWTAIMSGHCHL